jgi:hypothetical protein
MPPISSFLVSAISRSIGPRGLPDLPHKRADRFAGSVSLQLRDESYPDVYDVNL